VPTTKAKQKKETQKTPELTKQSTKTIYTPMWYSFYDLQPGNGVSPILTATEPTRGNKPHWRLTPTT